MIWNRTLHSSTSHNCTRFTLSQSTRGTSWGNSHKKNTFMYFVPYGRYKGGCRSRDLQQGVEFRRKLSVGYVLNDSCESLYMPHTIILLVNNTAYILWLFMPYDSFSVTDTMWNYLHWGKKGSSFWQKATGRGKQISLVCHAFFLPVSVVLIYMNTSIARNQDSSKNRIWHEFM